MSTGPGRSGEELTVVCNLAGHERARRREAVRGLLDGARLVGELEDGYELAFPGDADWAMRLTQLVVAEQACCPFFTFELVFEPGGGGILLRVRGPEGTKEFMEEEFSAVPGAGR